MNFIPVYSDAEDSVIGGNYTISNLSSCWLGSLRNQIGGNATFTNNQFGDPDAMEIGNNIVNGNLSCSGNDPAAQFGDGAAPEIVGGNASGECGFDVVLPNPAAEAGGPGINEHFSVPKRSLQTFTGTHSATPVGPPLEQITTDAGNTLVAQAESFILTGNGLTGSGTFTGGQPGEAPGEGVLSTVYATPPGKPPRGPNATAQSFTVFANCDSCSFDGHNGPVTFRAYGTVTNAVTRAGPSSSPSPASFLPARTVPSDSATSSATEHSPAPATPSTSPNTSASASRSPHLLRRPPHKCGRYRAELSRSRMSQSTRKRTLPATDQCRVTKR